jgi:4-aminobutyrate aminotransferase-like enzyme
VLEATKLGKAEGETIADRMGERILAGHRRHLFPCVQPYYGDPLVAVEGSGVFLRDAEGIEYLDLFSGILTTSLGHCHPDVNARVKAQIDRLGHTSTLYVTEPQVDAAQRLTSLAPAGLDRCLFTSSGSEAIETAIMAARIHTGRSEVIGLRFSYHGRSVLATNLTAHGAWRPLPSSVVGVSHARAPYKYRSPEAHLSDDEAGERFAADLDEVIRSSTQGKPAAFIAETIMGVGGYVVPPANYFRKAAEIIRNYGGLFIADEVQAGLGRTGRWFAIEHWGVVPDIAVLAKGIANGFPVGATVTTDEIAASWTSKTLSTYGGNPICMAAADATLSIMEKEDVPSRAQARGAQLRVGLDAMEAQFDWIGEVRGMGLMQAVELVEDPKDRTPAPGLALALLEACRDARLLVGLAGVYGNVVRIAPSMLISEEELAEGLERFRSACQAVDRSR